jgi:hypothetical protein
MAIYRDIASMTPNFNTLIYDLDKNRLRVDTDSTFIAAFDHPQIVLILRIEQNRKHDRISSFGKCKHRVNAS